MWLTPNKCNDMHSCSIHQGDTYMSGLVPKILDSTLFKTTRAALFVTYDEGYDQPVYTVWAGSLAKTGYLSSFAYDHFSFLSTVEANWNLASLTPNDRDAPNMAEFFVGQRSRGDSTPPTAPFPLGIVLRSEGYDQPVYTVWAGSLAKTGYLSSFAYDHFSFLSTVEANWNLASLTPNDRDAPNMAEFFVGQRSRGDSTPPTAPFPLGIVLGIA